jgi:dihydropyrimidinase
MEFDVVIRHGMVVTEHEVAETDIGLRDGKIAAMGASLARGAEEIDAGGKLVLPGGIDSHCHLDQLTATGIRTADDFHSGTRSALHGGNTTLICFACQNRGDSLTKVVEEYHGLAGPNALIDYSFHLVVSDPTKVVLTQELPALIRKGYTSIKVYMTYASRKIDDWQMLDVLAVAREEGALVVVHAESDPIIEWLSERLVRAGHTAPKFQPFAHVEVAEREAVHRLISLSEVVDVPILIFHVSSKQAVEQIRWAQERGLKVYAETCPQYLFMTSADFDRPDFDGAKYMCSPPPRDRATQDVIWDALKTGTFQVFSSDHAGFRFDASGKLRAGRDASFKQVANGIPGIETRLPLLFSEGVGKGRISLRQFVDLAATNASKLYGLYPRKGVIAVGSDGDIAIWDPTRHVTIRVANLHDNMDFSPFEGIEVTGWPTTVLSRGQVILRDGAMAAARGRGVFLPREAPDAARPLGRQLTAFNPVTRVLT